jgi:phage terminase small subunit
MPRKAKPASVRLLEGRGIGRDSGGRLVEPPERSVFTPPRMPRGLPAPVGGQWRRVLGELADRELPMPPADVLVAHCRALVREHDTATALDAEPIGTTTWSRLIRAEGELSKRIAAFYREHFSEPDTGYYADDGYDPASPFAWAGPG